MNVYNYLRVLGAFTNANQIIEISAQPSDRQERKMLEEARKLASLAWTRREERLMAHQERTGEDIDLEAERLAYLPVEEHGKVKVRLQFLQDFMVRKMAAVQTSASIHSTTQVNDLKEVFGEYGVKTRTSFGGLVLDGIRWAAGTGQKPKVLVHVHKGERHACIRFEAANELSQKFLIAVQTLGLVQGSVFDLKVSAEDPAIKRNQEAGKKVIETGKYVNHNLVLSSDGTSHDGRPPKGQRFMQKPTLEQMERLFQQTQSAMNV